MVESTLKKKGVMSIHTKILLQMIAKRGNILWAPAYYNGMKAALDKVMLVGIDGGSKAGINIMAACGTVNSTFTNYATSTAITSPDKADQKYQSMLEVTMKCLEAYAKRNKGAPRELIVFMNTSPGDQISLIQENYSKMLSSRI